MFYSIPVLFLAAGMQYFFILQRYIGNNTINAIAYDN